jgi:hypothetical protein
LGQGKLISFWHDYWLDVPLKKTYLTLYRQAANKTGSISSHYTQDQWEISTHDPLTHQVQEEKEQLQLSLAEIKPNMNKDIPVWIRNESGMFTSRSTYKFITKEPQIETQVPRIWTIGAPPRV